MRLVDADEMIETLKASKPTDPIEVIVVDAMIKCLEYEAENYCVKHGEKEANNG